MFDNYRVIWAIPRSLTLRRQVEAQRIALGFFRARPSRAKYKGVFWRVEIAERDYSSRTYLQ